MGLARRKKLSCLRVEALEGRWAPCGVVPVDGPQYGLAAIEAAGPTVHAHGGGRAVVTDPDGHEFSASFAISGVLNSKGTAHGSVNFVFGPEFSAMWGAAPGVRAIHVWGQVTSITVDGDGTIRLSGTATEVDVLPGGGTLVFEDEPFEVVISASGQSTFQWCELPVFEFEVTKGNLVVR